MHFPFADRLPFRPHRPTVPEVMDFLTKNRVWRSFFRHGYPDTKRNQALLMQTNVFLHLFPVKVRVHSLKATYTWGLGLISFYLFLILTITGVLLMFYYVPAEDRAYQNMMNIIANVNFGALMRNMHRWAAHAMVLGVFLHMCRVFYTGGHKEPREFNWAIGVLLLFCTFFLSFTGYLLPWDQLSYWAVTVGSSLGQYVPPEEIMGKFSILVLRGTPEVSQSTLVRFYTLHVVGLPLALAVLLTIHFWRIRKDGGLSGPYGKKEV